MSTTEKRSAGGEMNTYSKFAPNVFVAKCENPHEKGDFIMIQNRWGQKIENVIHNLVRTHFERDKIK